MDLDKIIQELNGRFAAPLPEFYKRRIIFWHDEEKEFADRIDEISLSDVEIIKLTGSNNFEIKKLLCVDDLVGNYLVYCPLSYEKTEDNWLLDIELYSEEFRADLISIWMNDMGIPATPALRKQVKCYRKYFKTKSHRDKISSQNKSPEVPAQLHMAVMGALCGSKNITPASIIKDVLKCGLDVNTNCLYREFVSYGANQAFWSMVKQGTGYEMENPDLGHLATHIVITAATRTMRLEFFAGLDGWISSPHQAYCYDFVSDWMHSEDAPELSEMIQTIEDALGLPSRFMKMEVRDLVDTEIFPCINEAILTKLMTEIGNHIIDIDVIRNTVEKRRTLAWYDEVKDFYEGILQVTNMQEFFKEHSTGFHNADAKGVWKEYTTTYYKMDTYYRLFHQSYGESLKSYNSNLHDLFNYVMEQVEGLYTNWFLSQLGGNWQTVCAEELEKYGYILEIPKQTDFYKTKVEKANAKVYVIISDALRYEVAVSLADQLRRETQSKVELGSMQGAFPTITKFGMAGLLPHKHLEVTKHGEVVKVLADGQSTDSGYRDKILKAANPDSVALKYTDLVSAKRAERSAMVKGMEVVYIYHDTIDEASHTSDSMVFPACENAIVQLKNLVKIIVNDFGATNIIITADHGFLFTYSPLTEDDKIDKAGFVNRIVQYGRRYAIMTKDSQPEYLQKVRLLDGDTEFEAYAPKENIRIKGSGGLNYVHGGTSLQEMVVPVIEYRYLRNNSAEYQKNKHKYDTKLVEIALLSATHKISNMIFSLSFYQKEAVGDNREAANYQVYFTDANGKQISDVQKIIADKTSDNGQERTFRCSFNLKSQKYDSKEIYYLVIADENGMVTSREEFQIDIAFAVDEFDFFG
jgi:uncharacterized protein (TIGR02687 family)